MNEGNGLRFPLNEHRISIDFSNHFEHNETKKNEKKNSQRC